MAAVAARVDAGGRDADRARLRLHRVDQLVHVLYGVFGFTPTTAMCATLRNSVQSPMLRVEHARAYRVGAEVLRGAGRPRVAVLRRFDRVLGADRSRGAGLVQDDDLLAERLLDLGRRDAGDLVGRAAGGPRHDDRDGLLRLPLRRRGRRSCDRQAGDDARGDQLCLAVLHGEASSWVPVRRRRACYNQSVNYASRAPPRGNPRTSGRSDATTSSVMWSRRCASARGARRLRPKIVDSVWLFDR